MYIDAAVTPSRSLHVLGVGFVAVCLLLMWQAGAAWWQLVLTAGVGAVVLALNLTKPTLVGISSKDPAHLWEFAIRRGGDVELWQGYVNATTRQAGRVVLDIHVTEPHSERMWLSIGRQNVDADDYRKLSALARVGKLEQS